MEIKNPFQKEEHTFPQLSPLIDVLFLLLVFFMLTATFSKEKTKNIELPIAKKASKFIEYNSTLKIIIKNDGGYEVNGVIYNQETLIDAVNNNYKNSKSIVLIIADKNAPFQSVVFIYDVMQFLGISKFTHKVMESQ